MRQLIETGLGRPAEILDTSVFTVGGEAMDCADPFVALRNCLPSGRKGAIRLSNWEPCPGSRSLSASTSGKLLGSTTRWRGKVSGSAGASPRLAVRHMFC
jgi:hypothetical protein